MMDLKEMYPLLPMQQGLLFHTLSSASDPTYVELIGATLKGNLNVEAYKRAWATIIQKHSVLRSSFSWENSDEPMQMVADNVNSPWVIVDLRGVLDPQKVWEGMVETDQKNPLSLQNAPVMRFLLAQVNDQEWRFLWTHHHILLDGWSFGIVLRDVLNTYRKICDGDFQIDTDQVRPFKDFVTYHSQLATQESEKFWKFCLGDFSQPTSLVSGGRPTNLGHRSGVEKTIGIQISKDVSNSVNQAAKGLGITLSTLIHAAFSLVLQRYTGRDESVFLTSTSGRPPEFPGIDKMVGLFINAIPFRVSIKRNQDLGTWLKKLDAFANQMFLHQYIGLQNIANQAKLKDGAQFSDVMFSFQNFPLEDSHLKEWAGVTMSEFTWRGPTNYPVAIRFFQGDEYKVNLSYNADMLTDEYAHLFLNSFKECIEDFKNIVGRKVFDVRTVAKSAENQWIYDWNDTHEPYHDEATLCSLLSKNAKSNSHDPAVMQGENVLSYGSLNKMSNQFARYLHSLHVKNGDRVGVLAKKSSETVVAMVGILKAGAAFVPIDPAYPQNRIDFMITDSDLAVVLTDQQISDSVTIGKFSDQDLEAQPTPADIAYHIYTSGSSGQPKGCVLNHQGRVNNFEDFNRRLEIKAGEKVLNVSSLSFDMSAYDIFGALISGACVVFPEIGKEFSPEHWLDLIQRERVSIWHSAPQLFDLLLTAMEQKNVQARLKAAILGGDWVPVSFPERAKKRFPGMKFVSAGGATEVSVDSVYYEVEKTNFSWPSIPYGKPMANQYALILNQRMEICPPLVPGELHLGGVGVGNGYYKRPELTAEKFVSLPYPDMRYPTIYKTGDLAKYDMDGTVILLGRIDFQLKINGLRIEAGEVEAAIKRSTNLDKVVVAGKKDSTGENKLIAYIVGEFSQERVREELKKTLPFYMIPADFISLESFPLSPNGKLDRSSLPILTRKKTEEKVSLNHLQKKIAAHWAKTIGLSIDSINSTSNFFDLGGTSIKAIKACMLDGIRIKIADLYKYPTLESLAHHIETQQVENVNTLRPLNSTSAKMALICFPYGGGTPEMYFDLARRLEGLVSVYGAIYRGHEVHDSAHDLEGIDEFILRFKQDAAKLAQTDIALYGHCGGTAWATAAAYALEEMQEKSLRKVFVGATYPPESDQQFEAHQKLFLDLKESEIALFFSSLGAFEKIDCDLMLARIGKLLKHDGRESSSFFLRALTQKNRKIKADMLVICGVNDPLTPNSERNYQSWRLFAENVQHTTVPGGHYFLKESLADVLDILQQHLGEIYA